MRLIKIQYPFLEKIPLCRERKYCGIEHTEFIEVVKLSSSPPGIPNKAFTEALNVDIE